MFTGKFVLPEPVNNTYSILQYGAVWVLEAGLADWHTLRKWTLNALKALKEDSATGPDKLPTRLLKACAEELADFLTDLVLRILLEGEWPDDWREHWVVPLYKKKSVWDALNYRGVHLTSQLSKVVERVLAKLLEPYLELPLAQGPYQFAYRKERGARDALLLLVCSWLVAFNTGKKVAVYCADVAAAFDRVDAERLAAKLKALGVPVYLLRVLESWLAPRRARVVLEGKSSRFFQLVNMVFQGTVLGPPLWNVYYADCSRAVRESGFLELLFADDLNCWKLFPCSVPNHILLEAAKDCQAEVHSWGAGNRVVFDAGKESLHVVSHREPEGGNFKVLGVDWDPKVLMRDELETLVGKTKWKVVQLLRARRFFTGAQFVKLYTSDVLGFVEYRTAAVYHACPSALTSLDNLQEWFLRDLGLTAKEALEHFKLAPLSSTRDIAMLGVVLRAVLGKGPSSRGDSILFHQIFVHRFFFHRIFFSPNFFSPNFFHRIFFAEFAEKKFAEKNR